MRVNTWFAVLMLAALARPGLAQDGAAGVASAAEAPGEPGAVTPYRPSVSSPAQLPLAGQLEFELGGLVSRSDGVRRDSLPYTFKLAWNEEWGMLLSGEAYVGARADSGRLLRGGGDSTLVLKRAFVLDSATAFGLETSVKLPTAKRDIGSGKPDLELNGIFSQDLASVHMDANVNLTRLGAYEAGSGRVQTGLSAAFSAPVTEQWGATAELSGYHRRAAPGGAQVLLAASYSPSKRLAIDVGFAKGLRPASPDWSWFSGLVLPLARFW